MQGQMLWPVYVILDCCQMYLDLPVLHPVNISVGENSHDIDAENRYTVQLHSVHPSHIHGLHMHRIDDHVSLHGTDCMAEMVHLHCLCTDMQHLTWPDLDISQSHHLHVHHFDSLYRFHRQGFVGL